MKELWKKRLLGRNPGARRTRGFILAIVCCAVAVEVVQHVGRRREAPDDSQRIAATLISWGLAPNGMSLPVGPDQIDRRVALLRSDVGAERVRASHWLASRGIRQAGPAIAAAMNDPRAYRSCQFAHDLGVLGDDRWVGVLATASKHPRNEDLRLCATRALGRLASPKAVDVLIDVHHRGTAGLLAIESLGRIGDPAALPFLQSLARSPRTELQRRTVGSAIRRIEIMQQSDPLTALLERVEESVSARPLDDWALRTLVAVRDPRAIPVLRDILIRTKKRRRADCLLLAAALLTFGDPGVAALEEIAAGPANAATGACSAIARAALSLLDRSVVSTREGRMSCFVPVTGGW